MSLHQAPCDDHALALARLLQLHRVANLLERFILGRLEKSASVDDDRVRLRSIRRDGQTILRKEPEHPLAVHEVLRTTEADKGHGLNKSLCFGHRRSRSRGPAHYLIRALNDRV